MDYGNILIIEDDADIREGVRVLLTNEGYGITEAENGEMGLAMLHDDIDLVILDIMMPGISGIKTCEEIRRKFTVPVLFLTAKAQESDKLLGLMAGGDDYLAKPFSYAELLGRVKALLRRYQIYQGKSRVHEPPTEIWLEHKGMRILTSRNQVFVDGKELSLSETEYQILLLLTRDPNKVFTAQDIYENVWREPYFYSSNNTITVHIRNLRQKVEDNPQQPKRVCTVWGRGYQIG